ncbi:MAG: periplasmic heavy metal sensor [Candidatus Eisenbacteria bacterium]|nr:periplasmic heavy metal sensor [Candidatus Eisenbacteria bacterium]
MKRGWFFVLAFSLGLNAGLLYVTLAQRGSERDVAPAREARGPLGERDDRAPPPEGLARVIRDHLRRMTRDLDLDPQQRSAIAAIHEELLPRIAGQRREMRRLRGEVASLYAREEVTPAEFRAKVRQLSNAQARLDSLVTEAMLAEAALLTPEQRRRYVRHMPWGHPLPPQHRGPPDHPPRRPPPGHGREPGRGR